jgi:hypothetical protein
VIAFRIDERIGAGFQADGTFEFFLKKFLEGCMDGRQCEEHDWAQLKMLVIGNMIWFGCCVNGSLWKSLVYTVLDGFDLQYCNVGQATVKAQASWNNFNGYLQKLWRAPASKHFF